MTQTSGGIRAFAFIVAAQTFLYVLYLGHLPAANSPFYSNQLHFQPTTTDSYDDIHHSPPHQRLPTLEELTGNPPNGSLSCSPPLVPIYDRIVNNFGLPPRKIPRYIHVSMKNRCMPQDIADATMAWKKAFPYHSFYFHDDDAVDKLLSLEWEAFPQLQKMLRCVRFKGAMKIDVWRVLIVYQYGGIYTDIDNVPELIGENRPITNEDEAFFLSDAWNRPSQWFFAMEPKHPVAFYALYAIFGKLQELESIEKPRVVFVTGPDVFKLGYGAALGWDKQKDLWAPGTHRCKFNKTVTKFQEKENGVPWVRPIDFGTIVKWNETENVTKRERIERQHGVVHWTKQVHRNKNSFS
ncbi:hypothetical protein ACHAXS_000459, partial [Conticribra weissflogii]